MDRVGLERVRDNPFQTRQVYGELTELADSILAMRGHRPETSGLIQVPPGRIVLDGRVLDPGEYGGVAACLGDEPEAVVELAAGHRRLRAFQNLRNVIGSGDFTDGDGYDTFPVEVQVLGDEAMADIAWEENVKRKDLSPIEEAEALRQAMESFGWTQAEVGERWGLSQPAVANKLRLLQLPDPAQEAIRMGQIGERHGRALLKALGKSERIYERAARDILPLPAMAPEIVAKAQEVVDGGRVWNTGRLHITDIDSQRCEVCGGLVDDGNSDQIATIAGDDRNIYLCLACARAGTGWSPPSTAEAEEKVERAIQRELNRLGLAKFSLKEQVGEGDPLVQQARCEGCAYQEERKGNDWCLDSVCFRAKEEHWYGHLVIKLQMAARQKWPDDSLPPVLREYGGRDLSSYSDTDKAMVAAGHCGAHCSRLRMRYGKHGGIRPFPELPFVYNCDNTNAYNACVRRFVKGQRSEEDVAEEKRREREAAARRKEAREVLRRAEVSVARALRAGHEGAWRELASRMGAKVKAGQKVEVSVGMVAERMLDMEDRMNWWDWEKETAVEDFVKEVLEVQIRWWEVRMVGSVEDLEGKLERMSGFLVDVNRGELEVTEAMVRGNLDNLSKMVVEVADLHRDGLVPEGDLARVLGWVEELKGEWGDISREMGGTADGGNLTDECGKGLLSTD